MRRWPRHALALESRRGRGRRRRLQSPHARAGRPADCGHRGAGTLDPGRRPRDTADLVYTGRGSLIWLGDLDAWAAVIARLLSPTGRFVLFEGHPVEWLFDADADGHWIATDYDYFAGAEASRGWAPEYIERLSIADDDQSWKFARAWTLGEVITALLGADLRLERVAEYPVDWWGGHGDVRPEERGRIPLSFSVTGRRASG
jgi:SAM-dependent methyltransferase